MPRSKKTENKGLLKQLLQEIASLERGIDDHQLDIVDCLGQIEKLRPWTWPEYECDTFAQFMRKAGIGMEPDHYQRAQTFVELFGRKRALEVGFLAVIEACRLGSTKDKNRFLDKVLLFQKKHGRRPGLSKLYQLLKGVDPNVVKTSVCGPRGEIQKLRLRIKELEAELERKNKIIKERNKELADLRAENRELRARLK